MVFKDLITQAFFKEHEPLEWISADLFTSLHLDEFYPNMEDCRLKTAWIKKWYCTDTWVGTWILLLDDTVVAIAVQSSRKSMTEYKWISRRLFDKTRAHVQSLQDQSEFEINPILITNELTDLVDSKGYTVTYVGELLESDLILSYTGEFVKFIRNATPTNHCSKIAIVQREDGSLIHVTMDALYIPWCTQENTRTKYNTK